MGYKVCVFTRLAQSAPMAMYRIVWPFETLTGGKKFDSCTVITQPALMRLQKERRLNLLLGYDLYIVQRIVGPSKAGSTAFFNRLRESGKVVFETDDDLTDDHRWVGYGEWMAETMEHMDGIVVSTPELACQMEQFGKPVRVAFNRVKTKHFAHVSRAARRVFKDKLVIGLCGTRTHWGDWLLVRDALCKIKRCYPGVQLVTAGYRPPYFDIFEGMEFLEQVQFELYPAILRQMTIRLCPLDTNDQFNASKSAISALEAMAAARPVGNKIGGAIPICSDSKQFRRVIQNRHNGLVVKNNDWFSAIAEIIEDPVLRQKLAVRGHKWVKKNRDIADASEFEKAYLTFL